MKDVNFILDNFPIEELVDIDDQFLHNQTRERLSKTTQGFKEIIHSKQLYYKYHNSQIQQIPYLNIPIKERK